MVIRSWWGWGTLDQQVTGLELQQLLNRVGQFLEGETLEAHSAPDPSDLQIRAPRITSPSSLQHLISDDITDRAGHAHGKAYRDVVRNLRGHVKSAPDFVVRPRDEADVIRILDWCSEESVTVIPYGGGTSVVGGVEARFEDDRPVISLDLEHLNKILEIDRTSRAARIQAGILSTLR